MLGLEYCTKQIFKGHMQRGEFIAPPGGTAGYGLLRSAIFDRHNSELAPAPKVNLNSPTEKPSVDFFGLVRHPLAYPEDRPRLLAAVEVYIRA